MGSENTEDLEPFEPELYPDGLKLFEIQFDYPYDIAVPAARPIDVRLPKLTENEVGSVHVERLNGSITIDEARVSAQSKTLTRSKVRLPKAPIITVGLNQTQPIHYRIHKYGKIVAPTYRSKIRIRFFDSSKTMGGATKLGVKFFNQYLKAYRIASGDPVPYMHNDKKELNITIVKYVMVDAATQKKMKDIEYATNYLWVGKPINDGGMSAGFNTSDFDMAPKPYHQKTVFKTVEYGLVPEHMPLYNEPIIEAIELAQRKNEYGLGIVLLNVAFEGAIMYYLIGCLVLLDYDKKAIEKFILVDHKELEDKRKIFDTIREQLLTKYSFPKMKKFRGSAEERDWDTTTYKKRHTVVHITNAKTDEITRDDFKKALDATQKAIQLLIVPMDDIKKVKFASAKQPNKNNGEQTT